MSIPASLVFALRRLALCALAACASPGANAAPHCSAAALAAAKAMPGTSAYSALCAGKPECRDNDLLEIKPLGTDPKRLREICLLVGDGDAPLARALPVNPTSAPTSQPVRLPLIGLIREALSGMDPELMSALRLPKDGRLTLRLGLLADAEGPQVETLRLDLSPAWASGLLPLKITRVACSAPCRLGSRLELTVPGFNAWKSATQTPLDKLTLVVERVRLPGLVPLVAPADDTLEFKLQRLDGHADNTKAWEQLLPRLLQGDGRFVVGLTDDKLLNLTAPDQAPHFAPTPSQNSATVLACIGVLLVVTLFALRDNSRYLRDDFALPAALADIVQPFSLGRSQMLWWTAVSALATALIWAATGEFNPVHPSLLVLMGVGAGTAVGAAVADMPEAVKKAIDDFNAADKALQAAPTEPALQFARTAAATALRELMRSRSWWADVSSAYGSGSAAVHRLQMLASTMVIGLWVLYSCWHSGSIPTISATLLGLMGISGSTYVGFKLIDRAAASKVVP